MNQSLTRSLCPRLVLITGRVFLFFRLYQVYYRQRSRVEGNLILDTLAEKTSGSLFVRRWLVNLSLSLVITACVIGFILWLASNVGKDSKTFHSQNHLIIRLETFQQLKVSTQPGATMELSSQQPFKMKHHGTLLPVNPIEVSQTSDPAAIRDTLKVYVWPRQAIEFDGYIVEYSGRSDPVVVEIWSEGSITVLTGMSAQQKHTNQMAGRIIFSLAGLTIFSSSLTVITGVNNPYTC